jgi:hypothetical protein
MPSVRNYRKNKSTPYTHWHEGETGLTHCNAHIKAMTQSGYNPKKLYIQKMKSKQGEGGKNASIRIDFRVVGKKGAWKK